MTTNDVQVSLPYGTDKGVLKCVLQEYRSLNWETKYEYYSGKSLGLSDRLTVWLSSEQEYKRIKNVKS